MNLIDGLILLTLFSCIGRLSGSGNMYGGVVSILLGLLIFYIGTLNNTDWVWNLVGSAFAVGFYQTAHKPGFKLGRELEESTNAKWVHLDTITLPITSHLGFERGGVGYSWVFMGMKGLAIATCANLYNPPTLWYFSMFLLWPVAYAIGWALYENKFKVDPTAVGEYLSLLFLGLILIAGVR